jgi:PhnB protein
METQQAYVRSGFSAVRPYVYGYPDLPDFVAHTFGAVELARYQMSERGFHVESQIGDSIVVMEADAWPPNDPAPRGSIYVYVADVDVTYQRALAHGATTVAEPEDKPYDERTAGVKDTFGNTWWIATFRSATR